MVVDLQELLGVADVLLEQKWTPYFYSMLGALEKRRSPLFAEVKRWLFIFGSKSHRLQTMEFMNTHRAFKSLHVDFANYHLAKFERLGDASAGQATRKVILTFLQDLNSHDHVEICPDFFLLESPVYTKPHGDNELEFRVYNTKLRMNTVFIIMREFHDFEKIQIRSSRANLHHRLGNWNFQMVITYSNFVQTGHMRCFLTSTDSVDVKKHLICPVWAKFE